MYVAPGHHPGMVERGNIDLANRPVAHNRDGSISTVRSITIGPENGHYVLLPTVIRGRVMPNIYAIRHAQKTGQHLGIFNSERAADRYAGLLHEQQAGMYLPPRPVPNPWATLDPLLAMLSGRR